MARTDEEIRAFIRQQLPVPVPAPPPKLAIGGLAFFSFYHLLLVSFFVTVERFPEIQYFVFLNYGHVHTALYSMLSCIEAFYGLSFLSSLPKKADNIAVEYAGLMLANAVLSNHMIYMVNSTMFIYTCIWWSICLVLMFIRIGYDVFTQCRDKMFPPAVADNNNNA